MADRSDSVAELTPAVSAFLDISRFASALVVFLGHASGRLFTGGFLWQIGIYLQPAVMVFFVISGYVISYVTTSRERDATTYTINRVSRLYSVMIPALVLTAACDLACRVLDPVLLFEGPWGYPGDWIVLRYLATLLFIQQYWIFEFPGFNVPINGVLWSLSYEVFYYIEAGIFLFLTGTGRLAAAVGLALLAGPDAVLLSVPWVLGFLLHRWRHALPAGRTLGLALVVAGGAALLAVPLMPWARGGGEGGVADYAAKYLVALAFCMMVAGVQAGMGMRPLLTMAWARRTLAYLSALTFPLYVFHRPLIQLFASFGIEPPSSTLRRTLVIGGTAFVVATLGYWADRTKHPLRAALRHWVAHRATGRALRS
jgi:peptidoglycan/LPS O-acetylase OafA/YrhL